MKKLLVLMLVLGMASLASAVLVSSDTVTVGNIVWSVAGEQLIGTNASGVGDNDTYAIWIDGDTSPWADIVVDAAPSLNDAAGDLGKINSWSFSGGTGYDVYGGDLDGMVMPNEAAGVWYQFDLSGEGTIGIGQYPSFDALGTITVVPEPMTMVLLGLGGLFLRRRK